MITLFVKAAERAGALLLVALLTTACSAKADSTTAGEPDISHLINVEGLTDYAFPLDPYRFLLWQENVNRKAQDLLVSRCLARFGLDYPARTKEVPKRDISFQRRYDLVPAEDAARYGWHLPQAMERATSAPTGDASPEAALTPEMQSVLSGKGQSAFHGLAVPRGGCYGEANRALGAEIDPGQLADGLDAQALGMTRRDSRVLSATGQWSACMKAEGLNYVSPLNAISDPTLMGDVPSKQEIAVATASASCGKKANLLAISLTADVAYQKRLIEQNAAALAAIRAAREDEGRKAAAILAGSG